MAESVDFITHPNLQVRDLSYSRSRARQLVDLCKGSFFDMGFGSQDNDAERCGEEGWPIDRIEIYIKEKPRGPGYVCDIVYHHDDLPVTVYAILINRGRGLEVAELELFRRDWGCFDGHDNYLHPDEQPTTDWPTTLITGDILRRIPLGDILARVARDLPDNSWQSEGVRVFGGPSPRQPAEELSDDERRALENATAATTRRRGRPELEDELLIEVSDAYIAEAAKGKGAIRRLAQEFDRPEPTVRDWISTARRRGFLAATAPGRRGAARGPNLPARPGERDYLGDPTEGQPDLSPARRQHVLRMLEQKGSLDDADLSESALLQYIVMCLVCNTIGVAKLPDLRAAMEDPNVMLVAVEILDKARRRHTLRKRGT